MLSVLKIKIIIIIKKNKTRDLMKYSWIRWIYVYASAQFRKIQILMNLLHIITLLVGRFYWESKFMAINWEKIRSIN